MKTMTGGEAVVKALRAAGVDTIFGIPGTQNLPIFDALIDEPAIRLIVNRHEQGAGYLADGYARASGKPGVLVTVSGPGAANALTALGQAYSDSSPVVLISSQVSTASLDRDNEDFHQLRGELAIFQNVTKWQGRARSAAAIPGLVAEAVATARSGRPRPVYLEIPQDILGARGEATMAAPKEAAPIEPSDRQVLAAARILDTAERPLLYVGGGAMEAGEAVLALAERLRAPVVVSANGKGAVPETHPLVVGSGWGVHHPGPDLVERADVVLALGTRFGPLPTGYWTLKVPRLIHVDVDPAELGKHYPPELGIVGDMGLVARRLLDALDRIAAIPPESVWVDLDAHREARREALRSRAGDALDLLAALRAALPDDALLYNDLNTVSYWGWPGFRATKPRTYFYPSGFGSLGFGLPAAIGGKIARPERPVVALTGDGGALYTLHELATAVQYGIGVVVVVFNSGGYAAIKRDQERNWNGRTVGVDLASPDFVRLAEGFGARGRRVEKPAELGAAVAEAIQASGPTVIEAPCPEVVPPWVA